MHPRVKAGVLLALLLVATPAAAVQPVFDPNGPSFYDLPWPFELRRDADGTVSLAKFPGSTNPLVQTYRVALEEVQGFGLNTGVFLKFDGDLDPASLPADAAASRTPGASVFLINIDKRSKRRGARTPLWMEFRTAGDAYGDPRLLAAMPVPGLPLEPNTLYALVVTNAVRGSDAQILSAPPFMQRMRDETPAGAFEQAALPLFKSLWKQLEGTEAMSRDDVVTAAIFRTGSPTDGLFAAEKVISKGYKKQTATNVVFAGDGGNYWLFTGDLVAPQFQDGTPPFTPTTGKFVFDAKGRPIVQREETVQFVLSVPKDRTDGTVRMPAAGWPSVQYKHGLGESRSSFVDQGTAAGLADQGIAVIGIDQPMHGMRAGAPPDRSGSNWSNPLNPFAGQNNGRQSAADSLAVHQLVVRLSIDPALISAPPGTGYAVPVMPIKFARKARMFMGHSLGAATGGLFLGVAKELRGGVLSAGGGHFLGILTSELRGFAGLTTRELIETVLGTPIDPFHPALHLLAMPEVSSPMAYAPFWGPAHKGGPVSVLCMHGMLDDINTTPEALPKVAAARYPLIAPTFPPLAFPDLPGYSYQEAFDLAGLATLTAPVSGNIGSGRKTAAGGVVLYEGEGHGLVFTNPTAQAQYREFLRSLAYDDAAVIPARSASPSHVIGGNK